MILVDTSVWIQFFRGKNRSLCEHLQELLDLDHVIVAAPVRIEILSGCSRIDLARLGRLLSALPIFYPSHNTWEIMERWIEQAISVGKRFGVGDLLIGAIAAERNAALWSLDQDFILMAHFRWIQLHRMQS